MDALHFGSWIQERRRACGWRSQGALVEAARAHPYVGDKQISEDFLARLEAGRLASPFRGRTRERVLALAWLLCRTPREVTSYVRRAELGALSQEEEQELARLRAAMERHQEKSGDDPQWEPEVRLTVVEQAWASEQYGLVVALVAALTLLSERTEEETIEEDMLRLGIEASRRIQDRDHLVRFLEALGRLYSSRGDFERARGIWEESFTLTQGDVRLRYE